MSVLLAVKELRTCFETRHGTVKAVDGVNLVLEKGDTLAVVGESGCGKTVLALSIMRLVQSPPGRITDGQVLFQGTDLLRLDEKAMRKLRGSEISMVFQEPMNSLNPVLTIGEQIAEVFRTHQKLSKKESLERAVEILEAVRIPSSGERIRQYPHQMSGGMRQRVMIAMALACNPQLLLADEPTTALDVSVQAQILSLLNDLKRERQASILLITHDLGVVAQAAQHAAVMYTGKVVESGTVQELFRNCAHPYTEGLMASIPRLFPLPDKSERLKAIAGSVPPLYDLPSGCSFQERCPYVMDICRLREPELREVSEGHSVRCWQYR